jgi:putative tryptophan/tyrosine transport system substrate-binding protein
MKRREFISRLGGAAAWPVAARAQQPAMPVVGFLHSGSPAAYEGRVAAFRRGLGEAGFVEGRNVGIEYRWAEGRYDQLAPLAAELVDRKVAVIVAVGGIHSAPAAKAATSTVPIVFAIGADPVALGLVASIAKPGGNATGVSFLTQELGAKRLGLLSELVPTAARIAIVVNPGNATAEATAKEVREAGRVRGLDVHVFDARNEQEIGAAFEMFSDRQIGAFLVQPDPLFTSHATKIVGLAARRALAAVYPSREYAEAGGTVSYGADIRDEYRQAGVYTGRVLKGEKPADLPVVQPTRFELVINLKTAKALGLDVPPTLLARADEVIEWGVASLSRFSVARRRDGRSRRARSSGPAKFPAWAFS